MYKKNKGGNELSPRLGGGRSCVGLEKWLELYRVVAFGMRCGHTDIYPANEFRVFLGRFILVRGRREGPPTAGEGSVPENLMSYSPFPRPHAGFRFPHLTKGHRLQVITSLACDNPSKHLYRSPT